MSMSAIDTVDFDWHACQLDIIFRNATLDSTLSFHTVPRMEHLLQILSGDLGACRRSKPTSLARITSLQSKGRQSHHSAQHFAEISLHKLWSS